ncbi:MAG: MATE family efflux transporter [Spirochaetales bacterium]
MSQNKISTEFSFSGLLKYAFPSIVMMLFISLYTIADGLFVARFVNTDALSALNIIYPIQTVLGSVIFMFSAGGSALIGSLLGQKRDIEASRTFSLIVLVVLILISVLAGIVFIFAENLIILLGADENMLPYALRYLRIFICFIPAQTLKFMFESFFITAGKPSLGLGVTIGGGLFNIIFDYVFIVPLNMGIAGAALATGLSFCIPALIGITFFFRNKTGLHFTEPTAPAWVIRKACLNGSSEMVTNLSTAVTTLVFNLLMMKYAGSYGVAAITAILYANFVMIALFLGFSMGVAPVISYHFGAKNTEYLKKLQKMCFSFIFVGSLAVFTVSFIGSPVIADAFADKSSYVNELIHYGMKIFSFAFIFSGVNIFASSHFTALSDGKTSALISFSRTFVFILLGIAILTALFGMDGVWISIPFAELMTTILVCIVYKRKAFKEKVNL